MTIIDRNVGNPLAFPKETNNTSLVGIDAKTAGTAKTTFGRERFEGGAPLIKRDKHQTAD